MKRLALFLLSMFSWANVWVAAITHEQCPICAKWHEEVYDGYTKEAKERKLPPIKVYDLAKESDRAWVFENVGYLRFLPTFVLMDKNDAVYYFDGYLNPDDFYSELMAAIEVAESTEVAPRDGLEPPTK